MSEKKINSQYTYVIKFYVGVFILKTNFILLICNAFLFFYRGRGKAAIFHHPRISIFSLKNVTLE